MKKQTKNTLNAFTLEVRPSSKSILQYLELLHKTTLSPIRFVILGFATILLILDVLLGDWLLFALFGGTVALLVVPQVFARFVQLVNPAFSKRSAIHSNKKITVSATGVIHEVAGLTSSYAFSADFSYASDDHGTLVMSKKTPVAFYQKCSFSAEQWQRLHHKIISNFSPITISKLTLFKSYILGVALSFVFLLILSLLRQA